MSFVPLTDHAHARTYYLPAKVNIGAIVYQGEAVIIDSGLDAQAGKRICRQVREVGWRVVAVLNTHTHADHIGGNGTIAEQFQAKVFTPDLEQDFARYPTYEPYFLVGGAAPWQDVNNKFLLAPESPVTGGLKPGPFPWPGTDGGPTLEIVALPGHSPDHIGVASEGVLFSGDAFIGLDVLNAHGIPFNVDMERFFNSLSRIQESDFSTVVPCHGEPLTKEQLGEVLEANRRKVMELIEHVCDLLAEPRELETVIALLCNRLDKPIASVGSFFLYRTAILAYLSYLHGQGRVKTEVRDNRLWWKST